MVYFRAIENILFENKFNKISLKLVSCAIIDNYMSNVNDCIALEALQAYSLLIALLNLKLYQKNE
jgi:hypothetical protein